MYFFKCPENDCDDFYSGEIYRRMSKRIIDRDKRDKNSQPLQHAENKKHAHAWINDLTILTVIIGLELREKWVSLYILDQRSRC